MPTDYTPENWETGDTFTAADATAMSQQIDEEEGINVSQETALATRIAVVTYSGSLGTTRPTAAAVYWVNYPSTPTNAQAQDIVTTASTAMPLDATLNAQTGTTYTVAVGDDGKLVTLNNASAITVTVPQNSAAAIPIGSYIEFIQLGAGQVTFAAGTGATVNSRGAALKINGQYGVAALRKVSTNGFILMGDTTT
jgi:hypothetical protein